MRPGDAVLTTCHAKTGNPVPEVEVGPACNQYYHHQYYQPMLPSPILSTNVIKSSQISFAGETSAPMNFKNSLLVTVPEGHEELEVTTVLIIGLLTMIMILQVSCTASNSAGSATETATVSVHSKLLYHDYRNRPILGVEEPILAYGGNIPPSYNCNTE